MRLFQENEGDRQATIALSAADQNSGNDGLLTIRNRSPEFYRQLRPSKWMQNSLRFWFSSGSRLGGLSLAFLGAGAKHVMVTQWQIPDKTSTHVIKHLIKIPILKIMRLELRPRLIIMPRVI